MVAPTRRARKRLTREERKAQTRQRLVDAAERVFLRRGFSAASVEEITEEAGYTRGAFYSNFDTKEELFVELLQRRVYDGYRRLVERVPGELSPRERLRWGAKEAMERQRRNEDRWLFELFMECIGHAARNPEFASLPAGFWRDNRAAAAGLIAHAFAERGRRPPIEPRHLATALIALDIGLAIQHVVDPDQVPLDIYPPLYDVLFGSLVSNDAEGSQ